ncbi:hypothetical protein RB213_008251 [Colletotrichum asianum]
MGGQIVRRPPRRSAEREAPNMTGLQARDNCQDCLDSALVNRQVSTGILILCRFQIASQFHGWLKTSTEAEVSADSAA